MNQNRKNSKTRRKAYFMLPGLLTGLLASLVLCLSFGLGVLWLSSGIVIFGTLLMVSLIRNRGMDILKPAKMCVPSDRTIFNQNYGHQRQLNTTDSWKQDARRQPSMCVWDIDNEA